MSRLQTENLQICYGDKVVVDHVNITIPDKKITTIIGANGCGKSTLLKAMTRIIPHQHGVVLLDGTDISKEKTKAIARKMAILPQTPEQVNGLTVVELVSYGRFPYQKGFGNLSKLDLEKIDWALEVTGTQSYRHCLVDSLSGGQRQRVWIAMALAQDTEIIFLDEPTTYLDIAHQLEVLELLQKLNREQGRTIVMVLHDINQAARFTDYMIALREGKVVATGDSNHVVTSKVLREVFDIEAQIGCDPCTMRPVCISYSLFRDK